MPVVELSISELGRLVGRGASKKRVVDTLPFLGLDIEDISGDTIRVEYSPNRPDYATIYGIAIGLQGLLGIERGMYRMRVRSSRYGIAQDRSVTSIRPYVTGIVALGHRVGDGLIRQLVAMQEDLHFGLGRRRRKVSMGIHDLDRINFPVSYTAVPRSHRFIPLDSDSEQSVSEILEGTNAGMSYRHILNGHKRVPVILDATGATISLPPIINSAATAVRPSTKNIFVEVTGTAQDSIHDALSVCALMLQKAGFELHRVSISQAKKPSAVLATKEMILSPKLVNDSLGAKIRPSEMVASLKKCRLDASYRGGQIRCTIPSYRFDIFGPMDLVEEVALGYGIQRLEPVLSPSGSIGARHPQSVKMRRISVFMTGLGYTEALNQSLTSERMDEYGRYEDSGQSHTDERVNKRTGLTKGMSVLGAKSQEHMILRNALLPGLVENLSRNVHESYPQKLFEIGKAFAPGPPVSERICLACVSSHSSASFTEIKSIFQALQTELGLSYHLRRANPVMMEQGRAAAIMSGEKPVGVIGELEDDVASEFRLRVPVACLELNLPD